MVSKKLHLDLVELNILTAILMIHDTFFPLALEREPLNFSFVSGWGIFVFRVGLLDHT
jgi:hypothetical protein